MDTLISNVTAVTMNARMEVLFGAYIGITEGKISYISKTAPEEKPATIIDGTGMIAIPGLINCHTHLATTALRSCFDDLSSREALENLLQKEAKMDSRCAKAAATLGIAECLRFGITSVSDLYCFPEAVAEAAAESGIKANIGLSCVRFEDENEDYDFDTDPQIKVLKEVVEKWNGHDAGRIRIDGAIYAEYTSNHPLWEGLSAYCAEQKLGMQLHLSQSAEESDSCQDRTGLTPAELLNCHGIFSTPVTAAGCGALTEEDMALLGKKKVSAVALPIENAKAGIPSLPISKAVKAGINVALGTGGAVECGNLDLFETMRAAAFAERCRSEKPEAMPAPALLTMATVCGAWAQGRTDCGMLEEGMDADIALVDFSAPHLMPCHNVLSGLVFSAKGGDVAMTMVRGKVLYQNGCFPTLDLKTAVEELTQYAIPKLFAPAE